MSGKVMEYISTHRFEMVIFLLCLGVITYLMKKNKNLRIYANIFKESENRLLTEFHKIKDELKNKEELIQLMSKNEENIMNAIEYTNRTNINAINYVDFAGDEEKIVIQFHDKNKGDIECRVFYNGEVLQPMILNYYEKTAVIKDINLERNTGQGIGSAVVRNMCKYLENKNIYKIVAEISIHDYDVKERLYNFYVDRNNFVLEKDVKMNEWGKVIKYLKTAG